MHFDLPESHREIQRMVREFCARHVSPHARRWDEECAAAPEVITMLAEQGLLGVCVPEAYGGAGLDLLACAVVVEEVARVDGSLALKLATHNAVGVGHLLAAGEEPLRSVWLPRAACGEALVTWAHGGDVRARRDGDDWVLDGAVRPVTMASDAALVVVTARDADGATMSFAVPRGAEGLGVAPVETMGMRSASLGRVLFSGCRVASSLRLAGGDEAAVESTLDRAHTVMGALGLGLGEGALAAAVQYAKDRKQFGQPIASFQAIQWMLADTRTELDAARMLVWYAAQQCEAGGGAVDAAAARVYASEAGSRACSRSLQVHGGYGYTREFPVERHLRDAKRCELGDGANEGRRSRIARALLAVG